jgi:hypothetical protein
MHCLGSRARRRGIASRCTAHHREVDDLGHVPFPKLTGKAYRKDWKNPFARPGNSSGNINGPFSMDSWSRMILSENRCTPRIKCGAGFFRIVS